MSIHRLLAASTAALLVSATALSSEAQAQYSPYYYNHHNGWNNGYRHHNGWSNGGAAAAGVVGGLALGALAAGAARPYGYAGTPAMATHIPAMAMPEGPMADTVVAMLHGSGFSTLGAIRIGGASGCATDLTVRGAGG